MFDSSYFRTTQAEALATHYVKLNDLSELATKSDLARGLAETKADLIKWMVGMTFAGVGALLAVMKLFPAGHP